MGVRGRRASCAQRPRAPIVAFSCKKRGFYPSCGGRRLAETAALLADEVLPERPLRQWVLSLPFALRFLLAMDPDSMTLVFRTVYRAISGFLLKQAGRTRTREFPGAVTLIQRFGSALNFNIHFQRFFLDGVNLLVEGAAPVFRHVPAPFTLQTVPAGAEEAEQQGDPRICREPGSPWTTAGASRVGPVRVRSAARNR